MTSTFICLMAVSFAPLCFAAAVSGGCPPDKPEVQCLVNPCAAMLCGPGTTCVTDYCGGCNANCEPTGQCLSVACKADNVCLNGYKTDKNGCETCECKLPICPLVLCAGIACPHGMLLDENGCNTCQCNCPLFKCVQSCPNGVKQDEYGCNTCQCNDPICPKIACIQQVCLSGFKKDKNGCDTCQCNDPVCPAVLCSQACSNGYIIDENGCNTCQCKKCAPLLCDLFCSAGFKKNEEGCDICDCIDDPCKDVACEISQKCENGKCVEKGCAPGEPVALCKTLPCASVKCGSGTVCVNNYCGGCSASCEPGCYHEGKVYAAGVVFPAGDGCNTCSCSGSTAVCTEIGCPVTKPGTCPTAPTDTLTTCDVRCSGDDACSGTQKCCSYGCSIQCLAPIEETKVCNYGGQNYKPGQTFPATDGCNTCTCSADGHLVCTKIFCGCPQYRCKACETGYVQDENGCNTCTCKDPACEAVRCSRGYECTQGVCCPAGKKLVNCFVDPCRTKNCGWWGTCRSNYCGGCNANCEWGWNGRRRR